MVYIDIVDSRIDSGKAFDRGKTSDIYAKYRDIYPDEFYKKIVRRNLCIKGQTVLDLGTGSGVLPRNMHKYGANWIGTDISQITRDSRNGRIKACREVGASLVTDEVAAWEREHIALLETIAPDEFDVLHYAAIAELKKNSKPSEV